MARAKGNWLRDYSQAVDVGTVKSISSEAIRLLLWVLGFLSFGYGTKEFEVTAERLGCYRPEEHIDNPKVRSTSFELWTQQLTNSGLRR